MPTLTFVLPTIRRELDHRLFAGQQLVINLIAILSEPEAEIRIGYHLSIGSQVVTNPVTLYPPEQCRRYPQFPQWGGGAIGTPGVRFILYPEEYQYLKCAAQRLQLHLTGRGNEVI